MPLVNLDNITVDFGAGPVLENISLGIEPNDRIGLVGPNGEGKTTLLSVICGEMEPYSGAVHRQRGLRVGFLHQNHRLGGKLPLLEAVHDSHPEIPELAQKMKALSENGLSDKDLSEYKQIENRFCHLDGYGFEGRIKAVLGGLGFSVEQFDTPVDKLSGGERNRAALACLLLRKPDLLLMDEPTNHIDYDGLLWLSEYLKKSDKPYIVVSHDRYFLDEICKTILEVRGAEISRFVGNYTLYERERARLDEDLRKRFIEQKSEIRRVEAFIRKNIAGQKTKQAQSRRKMLAKMERLLPPPNADSIRMRFKTTLRGGDDVLRVKNISAIVGGRTLFEKLDLFVTRGEKIGIVGPNGCGKTTLLSILAGRRAPDSGKVTTGTGISVGYYSQDFADVNESNSAFKEIQDFDGAMSEEAIRSSLALFSLRGDTIFRPLSTFSGGEIARVALLKLLLDKVNLLLLDEPTNHLDIPSRITLEKALTSYEGTLLIVSHDRYFLRKVANKIIAFEPNGIKTFDSGFEYYLERREYHRSAQRPVPKRVISKKEAREARQSPIANKKFSINVFKLREELENIEIEAHRLESERERVLELIHDKDIADDWNRMFALQREYDKLSGQLEERLHRWEEIERLLERRGDGKDSIQN